jgi:general stress protein 26
MRFEHMVSRLLLRAYKIYKTRQVDLSLENSLAVARQIVRETPYCFLVSYGQAGWPSARLVEPIADLDSFILYFGTDPSLRKVTEVRENPHVTVAFGNDREQANLVMYGTATLITDPALKQRFWKGDWRLFFTKGPTSDDYVVIRVEAQRMELMSFRRNLITEPFGLRPIKLIRQNNAWQVAKPE